MADLDLSLITPADLTEHFASLGVLRQREREMKTERWSARQEEANLLVAFRGGEPRFVSGAAAHNGGKDEYVVTARMLVQEVVALLSGEPIETFDFQTKRRPWRVTIKDRAPKMAGKIEATALGRGLLRVLPNICRSTYLYVEGSAAKR